MTIPVILFAYARPGHLARVLACLRENNIPLLYVFADGAKGAADREAVAATRALLRAVDWCEVRLTERAANLGLGKNVLAGVTEVAAQHEAFIVWEDDLICVPGTYAWMAAALRHYAHDERVMSVSAWTHPRITPSGVTDQPYFDARADCWVWGGYARAWRGMTEQTAKQKMAALAARGVAPDTYGADLPRMASAERRKNIWAVRWLYHHLQHGGLCLRPPWSMVEHIGFDAAATHAAGAREWAHPFLRNVPMIPERWPESSRPANTAGLWQRATGHGGAATLAGWRRLVRRVLPAPMRLRMRARWGWRWFRGDYSNWAEASAVTQGYQSTVILERVLAATLKAKQGEAAAERDGVALAEALPDFELLAALHQVRTASAEASLRVLDFGGALGSVYWRHQAWWPGLAPVRWNVVEQPHFVQAGRQWLSDSGLGFYETTEAAENGQRHDVLLCATALQYLEDPWAKIEEWRHGSWQYVLLHNLPLHEQGSDRLRVQHVPPSIYDASYPVCFFNRAQFIARVSLYYEVVCEYASEAVWPVDGSLYPSTGLLLRKK